MTATRSDTGAASGHPPTCRPSPSASRALTV